MKVFIKSSSVMSRTLGLNTEPLSYTETWITMVKKKLQFHMHNNYFTVSILPCWILKPYENGKIFNIWSRVASEAPTFSSILMRWTLLRISMVPLEILVAMESAWKKDVFSGPRPVFCGSMNTSLGAIAPALAGASTYPNVCASV